MAFLHALKSSNYLLALLLIVTLIGGFLILRNNELQLDNIFLYNQKADIEDIDFSSTGNYSSSAYCRDNKCDAHFFPSVGENEKYLLKFMKVKDVAKKYEQFLSGGLYNAKRKPGVVFVNGHSSNHHNEFFGMLKTYEDRFNDTYKLVVFNLGLSKLEADSIKKCTVCELRSFPFETFPHHVTDLHTYAFKPLIIHMMLQEYEYVIWTDTSIKFQNPNVSDILNRATENHIAIGCINFSLTCYTHPGIVLFFHENICLYCDKQQVQPGLFATYSSEFTRNVISYSWSLCALAENCMKAPPGITPFGCKQIYSPRFCSCSRFDQSALTLLLHRLFYGQVAPVNHTNGTENSQDSKPFC